MCGRRGATVEGRTSGASSEDHTPIQQIALFHVVV